MASFLTTRTRLLISASVLPPRFRWLTSTASKCLIAGPLLHGSQYRSQRSLELHFGKFHPGGTRRCRPSMNHKGGGGMSGLSPGIVVTIVGPVLSSVCWRTKFSEVSVFKKEGGVATDAREARGVSSGTGVGQSGIGSSCCTSDSEALIAPPMASEAAVAADETAPDDRPAFPSRPAARLPFAATYTPLRMLSSVASSSSTPLTIAVVA
mmetsp:Transcript_1636/g.2361  ORF Transcript_1636/g.2361 Transcript_1636/m.2361 type:complete len:209 (+) Transcript_1636:58-684(+)